MTDRSRPLDPPRPTPFGLECALLFGGTLAQIGWLLAAGGTFLAWMFLSRTDLAVATYGASATGVVQKVEVTRAREDEQPIIAYVYRFTGPDGRGVTGVSYSTRSELAVGEVVPIEVDPEDPRTSRIEGMRRRPFGPEAALIVLLPLFGLTAGMIGLRRGVRWLSLVRTGRLGKGRVVHVEQLGDDDDPTFHVTFEHRVVGARHRFLLKTRRTDLHVGSERPILYQPTAPGRAALLDEVRWCHVGPDGELVTERVPAGAGFMLLPVAALATAVVVSFL